MNTIDNMGIVDAVDTAGETSPAEAAPTAKPVTARFRWIPIRSLAARHRPRILGHLLSLDDRDRYLRFGYLASDSQIGRYVDLLDFERDEVFGVFNRRLELIAMAHLACMGTADTPCTSAEFGVSVSKEARGRGLGARLFDRAALHARNRHIDTLLIHALSENTAMLRIARAAGARIERDGPESQAWLRLPPENLASHVEALVEGQAAEMDFGIKVQAHFVNEFVHGLARRSGVHDQDSTVARK
jgi:GNAT superfamily N-acetyltransferase